MFYKTQSGDYIYRTGENEGLQVTGEAKGDWSCMFDYNNAQIVTGEKYMWLLREYKGIIDFNPHKALTWKEPYASLMLHGKTETRSRNTSHRGFVLICAGKQPYKDDVFFKMAGSIQHNRAMQRLHGLNMANTCGKAIAFGFLTGTRKMGGNINEEFETFIKYKEGLWCHMYKGVTPIQPFPFKGRQGWQNLDIDFILEHVKPIEQ